MTTSNDSREDDLASPKNEGPMESSYLLSKETWTLNPSASDGHPVSNKLPLIRDLLPKDAPTVLETWAQTYRTSKWAGTIPNNLFTATLAESIRQLFQRGARGVAIVDGDELVGWLVYEYTRLDEPVIHYVWVHERCRGRKVALYLMYEAGISPDEFFFYTHRTKYCSLPLFKNGRHEPAIARRKAP